jgi:hypothetical protein
MGGAEAGGPRRTRQGDRFCIIVYHFLYEYFPNRSNTLLCSLMMLPFFFTLAISHFFLFLVSRDRLSVGSPFSNLDCGFLAPASPLFPLTPLANSISWPWHSSFFHFQPLRVACAANARSLAAFTRLSRHWNAVSPLFAGLRIQAGSQPHPGGFYCAIVVAHSSRPSSVYCLFTQ